MKSKVTAYLLWCGGLLWICGLHRLYAGKVVSGLIWLFTFGLLGIGQLIDLFLIPMMIDEANAPLLMRSRQGQKQAQSQNIVVNVVGTPQGYTLEPHETQVQLSEHSPEDASVINPPLSAERKILQLSREQPTLTLRDVVMNTDIPSDEAEQVLCGLTERGLADIGGSDERGLIQYHF